MAAAKKRLRNTSNNSTEELCEELFEAICRGENVITFQALLQECIIDIDVRDSTGHTPLLSACLYRRKDIVDLLINSGANVDGKCNDMEYTALHYASKYGWTNIVQTLAKKVSDLDARDIEGDTAMHHASKRGHLQIVKCLIEEGADKNLKNFKGITPLVRAVQYKKMHVAALLLNFNANIDGHEQALLHYASRNGWIQLVRLIGKKVPDLRAIIYVPGETALHTAARYNHLEVIKYLIEEGIAINIKNECGQTALHSALRVGDNLEIVKWLVEGGTDIHARDNIGRTAIHFASIFGQVEVVKYLVEKGADINVQDFSGDIPLLCAAKYNAKDIVDLLMHYGANVDCSNITYLTLLYFASSRGWLDILQSLVKGKCNLDARDMYGITVLGDTCISKEYDIAKYLLQAGASWDIVDKNGFSIFNYVCRDKEPEFRFIKLLIENGAYLQRFDYDEIVKKCLKVLQDPELCYQAIVNKFNNHDLPKLYKLFASASLPSIEKMKIAIGSEVAQAVRRTVEFELQTKRHCNILEVRPIVLSVYSVRSVLEYYEKKKSGLPNKLKRPAARDAL